MTMITPAPKPEPMNIIEEIPDAINSLKLAIYSYNRSITIDGLMWPEKLLPIADLKTPTLMSQIILQTYGVKS